MFPVERKIKAWSSTISKFFLNPNVHFIYNAINCFSGKITNNLFLSIHSIQETCIANVSILKCLQE